MKINLDKLERLPHSRYSAYLIKDEVIKLESHPDVDSKYQPEKEKLASLLARAFGVYTPVGRVETVDVIGKDISYTTSSYIRPYIEGKSFSSFEDFLNVLGNPFDRVDFIYTILCDVILANTDNRPSNFVYDEIKDVLVPIDYDSAFAFNEAPMTTCGLEKIFSSYMGIPSSGFYNSNPVLMLAIANSILKKVNYKLLMGINLELLDRAACLEDTLKSFVEAWKLGSKYLIGDDNANCVRPQDEKD